MLLIASLCIIGDPLLDKVEVDNRQGRLQALHATSARGSKGVLDLLHSTHLVRHQSETPEKLGGMFSGSPDIPKV